MKKRLLFLPLFFAFSCYAQKVTIQGVAFDTTKGRNSVRVTLNDKEFLILGEKDYTSRYIRKRRRINKTAIVADKNGEFKIDVDKRDSIFFKSFLHITKSFLVADLLKIGKIDIRLEPEVCKQYIVCKDSMPKHYVFIGEKIKMKHGKRENYCNSISLDRKYTAEYKIIENLYGGFPGDTIQFDAYSHYGIPAFRNYKYVMLFVSDYCHELFQQKYQFYDVYKSADGRWAAPYQTFDYGKLDSSSDIKPVKINFKEPVEIDISRERIENYPAPYYRIKKKKAIALYGNYVNELLELKKEIYYKKMGINLK